MWEFFKSLFEASKERLKSPILGTYTISFIIWNWRAFAILLFSDFSIEDRVHYIDIWYCNKWAIIGPIFLLALITFCVPFIMMFVDQSIENSKIERKRIKNKENLAELSHLVEVASKEFEIQNQKSGTKTIEELQSKIDILESEKTSMSDSHKIERENNILEIQSLNTLNNNLNNVLKNLQNNKDLNIDEITSRLEINGLTEEYLNKYNTEKISIQLLPKGSLFDILKIHNLIINERNTFSFTKLGAQVFIKLAESKYSNDNNNLLDLYQNMKFSEMNMLMKQTPEEGTRYALGAQHMDNELLRRLADFKFIDVQDGTYTYTNNITDLVKYLRSKNNPDI